MTKAVNTALPIEAGETGKQLLALHAEIARLMDQGAGGAVLVQQMCRGVDALLTGLWSRIAGDVDQHVDMMAVGGYGRGELCPYSDWDLWFIVPDHHSPPINAAITSFMYVLWDMNVHVGHAVRTVGESVRHLSEDWNSATAALEIRLLHGKGYLFTELQRQTSRFFVKRRKAFVQAKLDEMKARHERGGGTAFLMEPDVKEGQGSLRDVHGIFWMAKAWYGVERLDRLVGMGVMTARELKQLRTARNFLWRCRTGLHLIAGRAMDKMGFEQQAELASRFGHEDRPEQYAVDVFMKQYFRHAGRISRITHLMVMHFEEQLHPQRFVRRKEIGDGLVLEGEQVGLHDAHVFEKEPLRLLSIFHVAQQGHRHLSSQALRLAREQVTLLTPRLRNSAEASELFLRILRSPRNVAWTLREMNVTGVLGRFIPDFRRVVGLGQFNRYHSYTVDEHTIRAVAEARNMVHGETGPMRLPLAADLMRRLHRPELIYIALIFHDIAKGRPGDHSELGENLARRFCLRLGLTRDDAELVAWLVRHHLLMAMVSQRSDISDPQVAARFAAQVGDMERLNCLLVLSVADIAAVGPMIWNEWKGSLLEELYRATELQLMDSDVRSKALKMRVETRVQSLLRSVSTTERAGITAACDILPERCIMQFEVDRLRPITTLIARSGDGQGVDVDIDARRNESRLLVLAHEREGLFAGLTGEIAGGFINVVSAHAYDLSDGRVLDVFRIQTPEGRALTIPSDLEKLMQRIRALIEHPWEISPPAVHPPRIHILMRHVPVLAQELPTASTRHTAIEVTAADRPGLLAQLAYAIYQAGYHLRGANISTFGEKVVDVFFLQRRDGNKLAPAEVESLCMALVETARLARDA
jgi:[protein-PII] uridylyltransferase